ncbi:hypothetical protein P3342_006450 [Pyrenophora teres f. teres]|nr:hypothetical protein P3342_006450 [Pyrenophora teres f. teres]
MAPKKDAPDGDSNALLVGFTDKETKLLAAAFVSCIGTDKYDYDLMATLTKNTAGSLKKMWPPVKKKASENHPSFASLLGQTENSKAGDGKDDAASDSDKADSIVKSPVAKKVKRAPAGRGKGRTKKAVKKEESDSEANFEKEDSANGDDVAENEET